MNHHNTTVIRDVDALDAVDLDNILEEVDYEATTIINFPKQPGNTRAMDRNTARRAGRDTEGVSWFSSRKRASTLVAILVVSVIALAAKLAG